MSHALFDSQQQGWKAKHQTCLEGRFPQVKCPDQVSSSILVASFGHGSNKGVNLDKIGVVLVFKPLMMIFFCRTNLEKEIVGKEATELLLILSIGYVFLRTREMDGWNNILYKYTNAKGLSSSPVSWIYS